MRRAFPCVMAAMQTRGDAGALQINGAEIAGVFNMGGSAVANYAPSWKPCVSCTFMGVGRQGQTAT